MPCELIDAVQEIEEIDRLCMNPAGSGSRYSLH
jgi:hypothetical protein